MISDTTCLFECFRRFFDDELAACAAAWAVNIGLANGKEALWN